MYSTREEWLRKAVELLDDQVFGGELGIKTESRQYQISCALLGGKKLGEVVMPWQGEDVSLDDFFPPTIHIDEKIKDPAEMVETLAHECIHCFMDIKGHGKRFKAEASKIGFEAPFTQLNVGEELASKCHEISRQLGEFPGKPVIPHKKEKKEKTFSGVLFCPECGYELRVAEKMFKSHGESLPTCPCGCKMALDCSGESGENEEE